MQEWIHAGADPCRSGSMQERIHAGVDPCRSGSMQEWIHAGADPCRSGSRGAPKWPCPPRSVKNSHKKMADESGGLHFMFLAPPFEFSGSATAP